jgi:hypothetical protein
MVAISYVLGRRYYPVPYDLTRLFGWTALGLGLYGAGRWLTTDVGWHSLAAGTLLMLIYLTLVAAVDGRRLLRPQFS